MGDIPFFHIFKSFRQIFLFFNSPSWTSMQPLKKKFTKVWRRWKVILCVALKDYKWKKQQFIFNFATVLRPNINFQVFLFSTQVDVAFPQQLFLSLKFPELKGLTYLFLFRSEEVQPCQRIACRESARVGALLPGHQRVDNQWTPVSRLLLKCNDRRDILYGND